MKKKGMTLIESVITIALLGVIFLLATPLIRSFGGVSDRVKTQKEIDAEFSVVNEFIQKKIKSAKTTGDSSNTLGRYVGVYPSFWDSDGNIDFDFSNEVSIGDKGNVLFLEIPDEDTNPVFTFFIFDEENNELIYREGITGNKQDTLIKGVEEATFKFSDRGIVVYHINLDIGKSEGKLNDSLRGSASTRIDIIY